MKQKASSKSKQLIPGNESEFLQSLGVTPGNWVLSLGGTTIYALSHYKGSVSNRMSALVEGGFTDECEHTTQQEIIANAKLMCASKDLLFAALDALQFLNDRFSSNDASEDLAEVKTALLLAINKTTD